MRSHGRPSAYRAQPPTDYSSGGGRARRPPPVVSQRLSPSVVPERGDKARPRTGGQGGSSAEPQALRVQCTRPSCGAVMHVLPEDLGLEPVTLEAVELEAVSPAQVLASDPALLSETPGAPAFKQVRSTQICLGGGRVCLYLVCTCQDGQRLGLKSCLCLCIGRTGTSHSLRAAWSTSSVHGITRGLEASIPCTLSFSLRCHCFPCCGRYAVPVPIFLPCLIG